MIDEASTARGRCLNPDCTVAETGICLEGHEDYETECPYYKARAEPDIQEEPVQLPEKLERDTLTEKRGRKFWDGHELNLMEAGGIMRARYTHLIGLVGPSNVGKTCFLIALYMKASSRDAPLELYRFAGSKSLPGFEERARRTRVWEGGKIPDKLSEHTILQDSRNPGFVHLRLAKMDASYTYDVLLTDLPGEWFSTVVDDVAKAGRLAFLRRADGILFFVDGERLLDINSRHEEVYRARVLLGRLKDAVQLDISIPFVLLVSKTDKLETRVGEDLSMDGVDDIYTEARELGFNPSVVYTASFSRCPSLIPSGYKVEEALHTLLSLCKQTRRAQDEQDRFAAHPRSFARFRGPAVRFLRGI
jgi:GTPase SAR1 family protein